MAAKRTKPTRKTKSAPSIVPPKKSDAPVAITPIEYGGLQTAFDYLNKVLFEGALPDVFITYQRHAHSRGHFSPDRFSARVGKFGKHEVALNPDAFVDRTDEQIVSTLGHEMSHLWQQVFGQPPSRGYHNKEWAAKMKSIGLMPSNTGAVGGKETGAQMTHYIIPDGPYAQAFKALAVTGWKLNLQSTIHAGGAKAPPSKVKFTCPKCGQNAWGKPDSGLICHACMVGNLANLHWLNEGKTNDLLELICSAEMLSQRAALAIASYDQQAA